MSRSQISTVQAFTMIKMKVKINDSHAIILFEPLTCVGSTSP